jgi:hypothetical protein
VDTERIAAIAGLLGVVATLLGAVGALYVIIAKGESAASRRAIRRYLFALVGVVVAIIGFVVWQTSKDDNGNGTTTTVSLQRYEQQVGGICDRRRALDEERQMAERDRDDRRLLVVLKRSGAPLAAFELLSPPSGKKEEHGDVVDLWGRHAAARDDLINAILNAPANRAMNVALKGRVARIERDLDRRVRESLNDLVGTECPVAGR